MGTVVVYGIIIGHIVGYHEQYANMGISFALTYVIKRIIKSGGSITNSEIFGVGGYSITAGEFVKLLTKMNKAGSTMLDNPESKKIIGGLLGEGIEFIKNWGK